MLLTNDYPPFPGFRQEGLDFLRDLKANNDRSWFKPRKKIFDAELKEPLECLAAELIRRLPTEAGIPVQGDPKKALFRIYRDTRFSKDKSPYKTNLGAVFTRSGTKKDNGGLYVHIEPGGSFVGGGFYRAETRLVRAWRTEMAQEPTHFLDIINTLESAGCAVTLGDPLKRMPRGIEADEEDEIAPYLKARWMFTRAEIDDATLLNPSFANEFIAVAETVRPFLEWGWDIEDRISASTS